MSANKNCLFCGRLYSRSSSESRKGFDLRRTCSRSCAAKMRKGMQPAPQVPGVTPEDAMQALGLAVRKWRVKK